MYIERVLPWKSSQWVPPPAEEIAKIRKEAGTHDDAAVEEGDRGVMSGETERGEADADREKEADPHD